MSLMIKRVMSLGLIAVLLLSLVGCNTTEFKDSNRIIEASELAPLLDDSGTVIIDARSSDEYSKGHLVGSINLPPSLLTISDPVSGTIAPKEQVEEVLGANGITEDTMVIIYDNSGGVYSSRVWWVLTVYGHENVKVVNNGQASIVLEGLELTLDVPAVEAKTYSASEMNASMIATIDEVKDVVDGNVEACIIDVRSLAEYDEGAIPGAVLYPHTKNLYSDGTFRSGRDTYLNNNDLVINKDEMVILYCKSSFRVTQTSLLLEEAGYENVKVYDGAWLEWSTKDMPKEEKTEEKATPSSGDGS